MKKSFVLLLALLVFISGTACYAQGELLKERDQVHFEEIISYGDKSAVEGVEVEMYSEYERQLFWHTTYTVGDTPKEETEYTVYPWYYYGEDDMVLGSFELMTGSRDAFVMGEMEEAEYYGLEAAMKELYDQTSPGEQKQMTVKLKDYEEYYRFGMNLQLPQEHGIDYVKYCDYGYFYQDELEKEIAQIENSEVVHLDLPNYKKALKDLRNFNAFFKIPVIEEEIYEIALVKDGDGKVIGSAIHGHNGGGTVGDIEFIESQIPEDNYSFWFSMYCEFDDGECFVTFNPKTTNGKTVDTSQIPGGFGVYRFTYNSEKGTVDSEHIEMIYALNPELGMTEFRLDGAKRNLLIETEENGRKYLSVIDRETMTLKDKFDIGTAEAYSTIYCYEDYMVTTCDTLAVYPMNENGRYEKAFEVDREDIDTIVDSYKMDQYIPDISGSFDWNGETLLFGDYGYYHEKGSVCEFTLAAINDTGLVYFGVYRSTLFSDYIINDAPMSNCSPDTRMDNPVIVHWKK